MKDLPKTSKTPWLSWVPLGLALGISGVVYAETAPESVVSDSAPEDEVTVAEPKPAGRVLGKWTVYGIEGSERSLSGQDVILLPSSKTLGLVVMAKSIQCEGLDCKMVGVRLQRGDAIFRANEGSIRLDDESVKLEGLGIQAQKES
ncbi:hypothetical protein FRD01_17950 [Microvenator marinus]|jgi:hypothetical protein|uniref:Uncharacterized protein n=1 Tax=Microvenator marinus TaxID=2600177 RepID=A0A5B8XVX8_9DELT|nr:hypothetical protein [Microvenator marinus]QED29088.1 hypothetical protein FRD01_17950 [Microvenator marinus]